MSVAECERQLKERFPALFAGAVKPLKLRIQADIQERAPGIFGKHVLSAFFRRHTGSTGYLVAMTKSPHRYDLDGNPSGDVSDEHRNAAAEELKRRRGVHQSKLDQAEEGRRYRAGLLRDFERTTLTPANFCALKGIPPETLDALLATARREAAERPAPDRAPGGRHDRPQDRRGNRPQDRRTQDRRPQDGMPQDRRPQDRSPQQNRSPQDGTPQQDSTPQDGSPQDRARRPPDRASRKHAGPLPQGERRDRRDR
jgi:sRNA-binding protein